MCRHIPYSVRLSLVACLTVVLTLNPAFAGRILQCKPKPPCSRVCVPKMECTPCVPCCCPSPCTTAAPDCGPKPKCGCDANPEADAIGVVVSPDKAGTSSAEDGAAKTAQSEATAPSVVPAKPLVPSVPAIEPAKVANEVPNVIAPATDKAPQILAPSTSAPPVAETAKDADPVITDDPVPSDDDVIEVLNEPAIKMDDDVDPSSVPEDVGTDKATESDDLFSQPADTEEAMVADDEVMDSDDEVMEADDDAMEEDSKPADSDLDDLFGTPETAKPADELSTDDDLFGDSAEKDAKPMDDDDLFGDSSDQDAKPMDDDTDDLFGIDEDDKAVEDLDMDDVAPVEDSKTETESDLFDDLFSPPEKKDSTEPANKPATDTLDDLFGTGDGKPVTFKMVPSKNLKIEEAIAKPTFNGAELRVWHDNTGFFSTEGRLVQVLLGEIRIQKTNGNYCTVPLERLSASDFRYVKWVVQALTQPSSTKFVSTSSSEVDQQ